MESHAGYMSSMADQLAALERIAAFSAKLRGHELGEWHKGEGFAMASCVRCGAELRVYGSVIQPEIDGPALDCLCGEEMGDRVASTAFWA